MRQQILKLFKIGLAVDSQAYKEALNLLACTFRLIQSLRKMSSRTLETR